MNSIVPVDAEWSEVDELDETEDGRKPWEIMPGESVFWYKRFVIYLKLNNRRTVAGAFEQEKKDLGSKSQWAHRHWYSSARQFMWKQRAQAYDLWFAQEVLRSEIEAEKELRNKTRTDRRALLDGFTGTVAGALQSYSASLEKLRALSTDIERRIQIARQLGETQQAADLSIQLTNLTRDIALSSALPDLTKAMEMLVKQMRTEYGDFILNNSSENAEGQPVVNPNEGVVRVIVYD